MARILVVDDDPQIREVVSEMLRLEGHEVEVAENGNDAVASVRARPYDIVITDLVMPGITGPAAIARMRQLAPGVPIVAITGADREPRGRAAGGQATATLMKPFERAELLGLVERLLPSVSTS